MTQPRAFTNHSCSVNELFSRYACPCNPFEFNEYARKLFEVAPQVRWDMIRWCRQLLFISTPQPYFSTYYLFWRADTHAELGAFFPCTTAPRVVSDLVTVTSVACT